MSDDLQARLRTVLRSAIACDEHEDNPDGSVTSVPAWVWAYGSDCCDACADRLIAALKLLIAAEVEEETMQRCCEAVWNWPIDFPGGYTPSEWLDALPRQWAAKEGT